jgi:metallophosphoesterase superfamily enzyme
MSTKASEIAEASTRHEFKIAVASDLHAFVELAENQKRPPSHLAVSGNDSQPGHQPIAGLISIIQELHLDADLLLCPGDLGHKARPEAIKYAWEQLHRIKEGLGAKLLVASTGNHDVDSRYEFNNPDPLQILKDLKPSYPLPEENLNDKYWARDFVLVQDHQYRLVVLNSSAHHGKREHEENHGSITATALQLLKLKLEQSDPKLINILLCHHHPQPHSELKLGQADMMDDGQLLLDLLGSGRYGRWLVIHGHKHHPKVTYAAGGCCSPVVFGAGSLCAELYLELQTGTRNQFHLITLNTAEMAKHGLVGRIESWIWAVGIGWEPAPEGSGLPRECGFGFRGDLTLLAHLVNSKIPAPPAKLEWRGLTLEVPELRFLLPQDYRVLKERLKELGVGIEEMDGLPYEVGKRK